MVNTKTDSVRSSSFTPLPVAAAAIRIYLAVVAATLVGLAVLTLAHSGDATGHARGHAIVVAVFAIVLPLRLRAARAGRRSAIRAVGLIGATLLIVNVVEALVPDFVPAWMRIEMFAVAALMLVIVLDVVRWAVTSGRR